ncbi:hypothetical protein [Nonomuraea sp. NPDC003201]
MGEKTQRPKAEVGARAAWTQALASGHQPAHELAGELLAESGSADA